MSTGNPPAGGNGGWGAPPAGGNGGWGSPPAAPQGGSSGGWGGSAPQAPPTGGAGGWGGSAPQAPPTGGAGGWGGPTPPAGPTGGSSGGWGGSTPPAGGNNGGWNPPPGGTPTPPKSGGGCLKIALALVVLGVLGIGALVAIGLSLPSKGKAELGSVVVENRTLADGTPQAVMIITLNALEAPEDPALLTSDLVVIGTSTAFSSDVVVSWDQLANADKDAATIAGTPPALNKPYVFEHVIESNLITNITSYSEGVTMSVELKWNGSRMDSETVSITHLYEFN